MKLNKILTYGTFLAINLLSLNCLADGNLALNSKITASSTLSGQPPENAVDGNISSAWNAGTAPNPVVWIEIDLGSPKSISEIKGILDQFPSSNSIHNVLLDGVQSHTFQGITKKGDVLSWVLPQATFAQKIRIETTETDSWVSWFEIEVIGPDSNNPIPSDTEVDFVTLADNFDFSIPVVKYEPATGGNIFLTANFEYLGVDSSERSLWKLKSTGIAENVIENKVSSFVQESANFAMKLNAIKFGGIIYWADFVFIGDNGEAGALVWQLTNVGTY